MTHGVIASRCRLLALMVLTGLMGACRENATEFQKKIDSAKARRASLLLEVEQHESIIRHARSRVDDLASLRASQREAEAEHKRVKEALGAARKQLAEEDRTAAKLEVLLDQAAERGRKELRGTVLKQLRLTDGTAIEEATVVSAGATELVVRSSGGVRRVGVQLLPDDFVATHRMQRIADSAVPAQIPEEPRRFDPASAKVREQEREREKTEAQIKWLRARIVEAMETRAKWIARADASRGLHYSARSRGNISAHLVTAQRAEAEAERLEAFVDEANERLSRLRAERSEHTPAGRGR